VSHETRGSIGEPIAFVVVGKLLSTTLTELSMESAGLFLHALNVAERPDLGQLHDAAHAPDLASRSVYPDVYLKHFAV